jgi:hypothetical protein
MRAASALIARGLRAAAVTTAAQENIGNHSLSNMLRHARKAEICQAEFIIG